MRRLLLFLTLLLAPTLAFGATFWTLPNEMRGDATIRAADGTSTDIIAKSYGTGVYSQLYLQSARGTNALPTQILSGDVVGQILIQGRDNAGVFRSQAGLLITATSDITGAGQSDVALSVYGATGIAQYWRQNQTQLMVPILGTSGIWSGLQTFNAGATVASGQILNVGQASTAAGILRIRNLDETGNGGILMERPAGAGTSFKISIDSSDNLELYRGGTEFMAVGNTGGVTWSGAHTFQGNVSGSPYILTVENTNSTTGSLSQIDFKNVGGTWSLKAIREGTQFTIDAPGLPDVLNLRQDAGGAINLNKPVGIPAGISTANLHLTGSGAGLWLGDAVGVFSTGMFRSTNSLAFRTNTTNRLTISNTEITHSLPGIVSASKASGYVFDITNTGGSDSTYSALKVSTSTASTARIISLQNAGTERFAVTGAGDSLFGNNGSTGIVNSSGSSRFGLAGSATSGSVSHTFETITSLEGQDFFIRNNLRGGYGSGINFYSTRSDSPYNSDLAGAIRMEGASAWNSDANESSRMDIWVKGANVINNVATFQDSGNAELKYYTSLGDNPGSSDQQNPYYRVKKLSGRYTAGTGSFISATHGISGAPASIKAVNCSVEVGDDGTWYSLNTGGWYDSIDAAFRQSYIYWNASFVVLNKRLSADITITDNWNTTDYVCYVWYEAS